MTSRLIQLTTVCLVALAALSASATAESIPAGYSVTVDREGSTTSEELGGTGYLQANGGGYEVTEECAPSEDGGPFSEHFYPPHDCAQVGRAYNTPPNTFWYTGNEHCVAAGKPFSGATFVWHVQLPATGYWHIDAYIPNWTQYGWGNQYIATSAEGQSEVHVVQQALHGQWWSAFGPQRYTQGTYYTVELTPQDDFDDGEDRDCHYQMAAQVRWVYDGPSSPSATISSPANGESYPEGALVRTSFSCSEAYGEPLESCTDSNDASEGSGELDTSTPGHHAYTVTARGTAGGTGTAEIEYTVIAAEASCSTDTGRITLSPGLTDEAAVQSVKVKGTLSNCTDTAFRSARYSATLRTSEAIGCEALGGAGAPARGTIALQWSPKGRESKSVGSFTLPIAQAAEVELGGMLESGPFSGAQIYGIGSQSFLGGMSCGEPVKKKIKPVRKGTLEGSRFVVYVPGS